jgi:disulfide bond formation protein DsbB
MAIMKELSLALMPYGILALQAGTFLLLLCLLFDKKNTLIKWTGKNAIFLSLLVTLVAYAGSLFYSMVMGYAPCLLCWWQRVFMVPQIILFFIAYRNNDVKIFKYTTPLSIIGGLIAIYHILLPKLIALGVSSACEVGGVSCLKQYVNAFGYITIPVMSLTVFITLILIAVCNKYEK